MKAAEDDITIWVAFTNSTGDADNVYYLSQLGDFQEIITDPRQYMHINTTRPVVVAQYARTGEVYIRRLSLGIFGQATVVLFTLGEKRLHYRLT